MQYRHMHDCPKVSRWVPSLNTNGIGLECWRAEITSRTQDNTNAQNQNATKIYGYAQRHGAGYGGLAFPSCGTSHGNLPPRSAAPNLPSDGTTTFHASVAVWCRSVHLTRFIGYAERAY